MQIIYRAFDGKEFDNEADCCYHESTLRDSYVMWDRNGKRVEDQTDTEKAFVLYLPYVYSAEMFLATAKSMGDTGCNGLDVDCRGLFFWDEWNEEYRYVDDDERRGIASAHAYIESMKGEN